MSSSALFIVNKFSGHQYKAGLENLILDECRQAHIKCRIEFTQKRGHATELARWAVDQKINYVFAAGGDGTVNEVAQGLVHTGVPMGILPKGSGNGLARHLRLPMNFKDALKVVSHHREEWIDTILINDKLSVNVSGIGFDAHVASLFSKQTKRGLTGYAKLVLNEFGAFQPFAVQVSMNGEQFTANSFIIAIANSSQFGNNARVAPQASVQDQLIDVSFVQKVPLLHSIGFARKMFNGNLDKSSFVKIRQTPRVLFESPLPLSFHIDGEPMPPARSFDCRIDPLSLKILLPGKGDNPPKNQYPL
ncbi:MAG: YegS/Rv2252/BmrU family lipid kinase [Bacteroidetes bacterium]|nr:YegS/Rv2252/BmrU family lipid kinase [Bacteroidota bacterium]MBS1541188.1 YegS/Rv2252/BmrU family lipid kinase [Bacteroidota bacterium]